MSTWLRLTDAELAKLVADYNAGASLRQLADENGTHHTVIRRALLKAGVQLRPMGQRRMPVPDVRRIARDYQRGMTLLALQAKYGIKRDTITRNLREQGVQIRPRGQRRRTTHPTNNPQEDPY